MRIVSGNFQQYCSFDFDRLWQGKALQTPDPVPVKDRDGGHSRGSAGLALFRRDSAR